jgi:hypothetical protein
MRWEANLVLEKLKLWKIWIELQVDNEILDVASRSSQRRHPNI